MANEENLKPFQKGHQTHEEAVRLGALGGKASGEARRRKKTQQEIAKHLLEMPMEDRQLDTVEHLKGYKGMNITAGEAALLVQIQKAIQEGDGRAYALVRDTAGEQPVQRVEMSAEITNAEAEVAELVAKMKARHAAE